MAKYNHALDNLVMAAVMYRKGDHAAAARLFSNASTHASLKAASDLVNAYNKKATATKAAVQPAKRKTAKAAAWPFAKETAAPGSDVLDTQNDEYGVEPEENDLMTREVQEADVDELDDDMEDDTDVNVATARFQRAIANLSSQG